ncbi:hypothetical protein [Anderseniella sp. Alg231-50]|uniref:hypothetical protein n=1 Tax=Anderseniella sp. Alg231-50 TaxID=1922226 RepID=UPI000D55A68A
MICKYARAVFAVIYVTALLLYLTGTYGWFGQETDALSGVFLIPLGFPWILFNVPDNFSALFGAGAPLINLALLWIVCRRFAS